MMMQEKPKVVEPKSSFPPPMETSGGPKKFEGEIIEINAPVQNEEELRKIEELKKLKAMKKAEKKKKKLESEQVKNDALPSLAPLQMKRQGGFEIPDFLQ